MQLNAHFAVAGCINKENIVLLLSSLVDLEAGLTPHVSCLVKLPLGCCNYPNTCLITTLSIHYDIYSTTIVLTGGQTWSWSAGIIALWPPVIRMGKNKYGQTEIWVDRWWTGKKMKEQKRSSKTIDIVSYALKVSVNGVMCVCSPFQVIRHI